MIGIIEAPNDGAIAKVSLSIGKMGAGSAETLKAFLEAEGYNILRGLP